MLIKSKFNPNFYVDLDRIVLVHYYPATPNTISTANILVADAAEPYALTGSVADELVRMIDAQARQEGAQE